jgi:hypothetical protein
MGGNPGVGKNAPGGVLPVERLIWALTPRLGSSRVRDSSTRASAAASSAKATRMRGCFATASATAC